MYNVQSLYDANTLTEIVTGVGDKPSRKINKIETTKANISHVPGWCI